MSCNFSPLLGALGENYLWNKEDMSYTVVDVFAGAGGFSLGFELAGAKIAGAVELDNWACETFKANHPDAVVLQEDIAKISDAAILATFSGLKPDILLGGPPCQGFSVCNRNNGDPSDPRNSLFEEFIRMGRLLRPSVMIMENVPNLMRAKTKTGSRVLDIITSELQKIGYSAESRILEASDYGVPQMRKRLVVIAATRPLAKSFPEKTYSAVALKTVFGQELKKCPTLWEAISDLPELDAGAGAAARSRRCRRYGSSARRHLLPLW